MFVFFQAEDGIRDIGVTGVQTCALPISFDQRNIPYDIPSYNRLYNEFGISPSTDFRFHEGMNEGSVNMYIYFSHKG